MKSETIKSFVLEDEGSEEKASLKPEAALGFSCSTGKKTVIQGFEETREDPGLYKSWVPISDRWRMRTIFSKQSKRAALNT